VKAPFVGLVPDLVVEVLSPGNRAGEIKRKLRDYFLAGVRVVWVINPRTRACDVYTAPDRKKHFTVSQPIDGGDVLPGFQFTVKELMDRAE
jgi:Uma2 family endonuclease